MKNQKPMVDMSGPMYEIKMVDIRNSRKNATNTKAHIVTGDIVTQDDAPMTKQAGAPLKSGR